MTIRGLYDDTGDVFNKDEIPWEVTTEDNIANPPQRRPAINFYAGFNYQKVSPELEAKLQNIMRFLASSVAQLRNFKFDSMGSINFPQAPRKSPEIVPSVFLPYGDGREDNPDPDEFIRDQTFNCTHTFLHERLDEFKEDISDEENLDPAQEDLLWGIETLFRLLVDCLPLPRHYDSEPETFVISPPDFGSQNLLCDEEGNITAILD